MTVGELLAKAEAYLASRQVPEPSANAEFLMAEVLRAKRPAVRAVSSRILGERQHRHFWHMTLERGRRVPLAYILGTQDFMGLEIRVTPNVLIPRPETEQVVEAAVEAARQAARDPGTPLHILEIGTGSGCVSIALAHLVPEATIFATDISRQALELAASNARRHDLGSRIRFVHGDLFQPDSRRARPPGWADLVVSNPPYVPTAEWSRLEPEVLKEPRLALDGGKDGMAALRAVISESPGSLKKGGRLVLEIGQGQAAAVRRLLEGAGFAAVEVRADLQGEPRIAVGRLN